MRRFYPAVLFLFLTVLTLYFAVWNKSGIQKEPGNSGAKVALDFWTRSRAYPKQDIPPKSFYQAFEKKIHLRKSASSVNYSVSGWEAMGPDNVPGRMISLAVNPENPNTLYAGSASGGLWRTYDASTGSNWHHIRTGFPVLGVMGLCIDHADTNTIYIGTGEVYGYKRSTGGSAIRTTRGSYGIGILKSTDGGKTWNKCLDWSYHQERGVQCIRMNPLNSKSLLAATTEGIYKTTDGGDSWNLVLPVLMGEDIIINSQDTSKIIVSCGNLGSEGSGLYRSLDAGDSWDKIEVIPDFSGKTLLAAYETDPNIVFASVADSLQGIGLYRTMNFGSSWTLLHTYDVPQYQGWFSHWVAVKPDDSQQVVHAGVQIYKSTNGGISLSQKSGPHVDHHNFAIDPSNPNILYIACDGGVYRSTNFGSSYQNIGYGLQTAQFYNGFSNSHTDSTLALGGLQDNNTVIYNGSKDWTRVIGGDGCWTAINAFNDHILYGEYQYNNMFKSTNRGLTFSSATNGISQGGAAFVAPFVLSESNPSVLYAGRRAVFKSTDGADSWFATYDGQSLDGNPVISMALSAQDPDFVYAGTAPVFQQAGIFRTEDGDVWEEITGDLPDRYPMDIAVDPNDKYTVYVVFAGFGSGHVYKSSDGGDSWEDITRSLPDVPTLAITVDPLNSDHLYVGNDLGVYVSTNGGESWTEYIKDLPEAVMAMDLSISPANRNIRLATHGNGAYQRPLVYTPESYLAFALLPYRQISLVGEEIVFSAQVTNFGTLAQEDTADLELVVLNDPGQKVYEQTRQVFGLKSGETVEISFENGFMPDESGAYTVHFLASGEFSESIIQPLEIITTPSIALAMVTKEFREYEEIIGGTNLPKGDDVQSRLSLPFDFRFDNFVYDKIQVSTNGWMEFGIGKNGTERGLSTDDQIGQIGANENGRLASKARPSKALGPWWEDLNTDLSGNTGQISYRTLGESPDRVFVMQWKNMRAYYSESTTTRLNFQIRLYETSNIIEYHYGPVNEGTFSGGDIGAMIGFKDHIGGDYHYYDIAAGKTGTGDDIITNLSPLTDWPGPDSVFVIQTLSTGIPDVPDIIPRHTTLMPNYPNPFNPSTTIKYMVGTSVKVNDYTPQQGVRAKNVSPIQTPPQVKTHDNASQKVTLAIYNVRGQKIRTLVNKNQYPGSYRVVWNGRDEKERMVSSGFYIYVLKTDNITVSRKMLLLK